MASATSPGPLSTKPLERLRETAEGTSLNRSVGALDLTAFGIGAIIGTGIFVIVGEAIGQSGPALVISFLLAGVTCIFSALSYAELASTIPVCGSAYTYAYATMGELLAWIIGWDLHPRVRRRRSRPWPSAGARTSPSCSTRSSASRLSDSIALPPGDGGDVNVPAAFLVLAVRRRADRRASANRRARTRSW